MTERIIETQHRQGLVVEKYIVEGEPGVNYRIIGETHD